MNRVAVICVFCASSQAVDGLYHETAADLGRRIGCLGLELVYGGASIGLMGAVARGVHEQGGRVVGVIPEFFRKQDKDIEYAAADELIVTSDMRERKAVMDARSDAFITLPGRVVMPRTVWPQFQLLFLHGPTAEGSSGRAQFCVGHMICSAEPRIPSQRSSFSNGPRSPGAISRNF